MYVTSNHCINREGWTGTLLHFPLNSLFRPTKVPVKEMINFYEICNLVTGMSNFQREKSLFSVFGNEQTASVKKNESIKCVSCYINLYHYDGVATPLYFAYVCLLFIGPIWLWKTFS